MRTTVALLLPTPTPTPKPLSPWQLTAERVSRETDSARLADLINQLCRERDEAGRQPGGVYGTR